MKIKAYDTHEGIIVDLVCKQDKYAFCECCGKLNPYDTAFSEDNTGETTWCKHCAEIHFEIDNKILEDLEKTERKLKIEHYEGVLKNLKEED